MILEQLLWVFLSVVREHMQRHEAKTQDKTVMLAKNHLDSFCPADREVMALEVTCQGLLRPRLEKGLGPVPQGSRLLAWFVLVIAPKRGET